MFVLDKEQREKLNVWMSARVRRNVGAIGGQFTYSFTPTSLGTVAKVKDSLSSEEIDLTDYESW